MMTLFDLLENVEPARVVSLERYRTAENRAESEAPRRWWWGWRAARGQQPAAAVDEMLTVYREKWPWAPLPWAILTTPAGVHQRADGVIVRVPAATEIVVHVGEYWAPVPDWSSTHPSSGCG